MWKSIVIIYLGNTQNIMVRCDTMLTLLCQHIITKLLQYLILLLLEKRKDAESDSVKPLQNG